MRKYISALVLSSVFAAMIPLSATTAAAQTRYSSRYRESRQAQTYYNNGVYGNNGYYAGNGRPNVYQRHRKAVNIAVATGAGAILGALLGGKKGALIGAAAGVAGGAIITKKQAPKNYYRY